MASIDELVQSWRERLANENPSLSNTDRESILAYYFGCDETLLEFLNCAKLDIFVQGIEYRYNILQQRYLGVGPEKAYRNLILRLANIAILRNKIQAWVAVSRDRKLAVADVLQELIQDLLHSDRFIHQQIADIARCTSNPRLRNALLMASIEEYCLRPLASNHLITLRFSNYIRRKQRGGITQIPSQNVVRLVSSEIVPEDSESGYSLLDDQAVTAYEQTREVEEQQALRLKVQEELERYLEEKLGSAAAEWFRLYIQGNSQKEIAIRLGKPVKEVYRLREAISYHATRVFAYKQQPGLVSIWLAT